MRITAGIMLLVALVTAGQAMAEPSAAVADKVDWKGLLARQDLVWDNLPTAWDAGAFLGNGLLGAMVYSDKTCPLRWDIGRSDVTDHRGKDRRKNNCRTSQGDSPIFAARKSGQSPTCSFAGPKPGESPNACFDRARLPIGHFVLEPVGKPTGGTMRLILWDAESRGTLTTDRGRITWRSFVHASDMAIVVEIQTEGQERQCRWKWVAEESRSTRTKGGPADYQPNPPSTIEKVGDTSVCIQPLLVGGQYATAWQEIRLAPDRRLLIISVGNSYPRSSAAKDAVDCVRQATTLGLEQLLASHRQWWHDYYPASFVSIPDARLESFYWIQMYKLGSATRADGLWIGRDRPLAHSHRHYSHLLMIYPLYVMNREQPANRDLITRSLDHWIGFEGALQGYSFTGSSSISASIGRRDAAVRLINALLDRYVRPNTMYLEGSPVIETPLSGAESLHNILMQSWGDKIRVFPGVPDAWRDVTFHKLRAEGAFLVSAVRRDGRTCWVRIESLAGEPCRIKADFAGPVKVLADRKLAVKQFSEGVLELDLHKGEAAVLYAGNTLPPLNVEPVASQSGIPNWYGSRKMIPLLPAANGSFDLPASQAAVHGEFLFYEKTNSKDDLGRWISGDDWAAWALDVKQPGKYAVKVSYGSPSADGRKLLLSIGTAKIVHKIQKTGAFDKYKEFDAGTLTLASPEAVTLSVQAVDAPRGLLINLHRIRLVPVH